MIPLPFELENYAEEFTSFLPPVLDEIERQTFLKTTYPQMLSGRIQAGLLHFLIRLTRAEHVLEIGTFTAYSSIAMASALTKGGKIITLEIDEKNTLLAKEFIKKSGFERQIELIQKNAIEYLSGLSEKFDFIFLDADKENYPEYYRLIKPLLKENTLWVADNVWWSGKVLNPRDEASQAIAEFNRLVKNDKDLVGYFLPLRDGLMLIQKNKSI